MSRPFLVNPSRNSRVRAVRDLSRTPSEYPRHLNNRYGLPESYRRYPHIRNPPLRESTSSLSKPDVGARAKKDVHGEPLAIANPKVPTRRNNQRDAVLPRYPAGKHSHEPHAVAVESIQCQGRLVWISQRYMRRPSQSCGPRPGKALEKLLWSPLAANASFPATCLTPDPTALTLRHAAAMS